MEFAIKIQEHLLHLNYISENLWQLGVRFGFDGYPAPLQIAAHQANGFLN